MQFRFVTSNDWYGHPRDLSGSNLGTDPRPLSHYSEPFNAECRAFGRLQETGREELAVKCFGYVLLDDLHEHALRTRFSAKERGYTDNDINFNWNGDDPGHKDVRSLFRTADGRLPPLRGIVKEFGTEAERLRPGLARKILKYIVYLQQLGILRSDVALRQLINGKIADFSTAITMPHFMSTPELNPHLNAEELAMMERELFRFSLSDYLDFDNMVHEWNCEDCEDPKDQISVWAYPHKHSQHRHNLRNTPSRIQTRVWTHVDTRLCKWRSSTPAAIKNHKGQGTGGRTLDGGISKRRWLKTEPKRRHCDGELSEALNKRWKPMMYAPNLIDYMGCAWVVRNGLIFPQKALKDL